MWKRGILKQYAKNNLRGGYWTAFGISILPSVPVIAAGMLLVPIILGIFTAGSFGIFGLAQAFQSNPEALFNNWSMSAYYLLTLLLVLLPYVLIYAVRAFAESPLIVGARRWFSRNRESHVIPLFGQVFGLFRTGRYMKVVGSMLWMTLFLFLWSLPAAAIYIYYYVTGNSIAQELAGILNLYPNKWPMNTYDAMLLGYMLTAPVNAILYIPYYIKSYSYRMTPWILADNPGIGFRQALKLSIAMTRGHKWRMFVLDLSFLGWAALSVLTCGAGFAFLAPYYLAVQAELYAAVRQDGIRRGFCAMQDFGYAAVGAAADAP